MEFINALLNSKLSQWYIRNLSSNLGKKGMSLTKESVQRIPIIEKNFDNKREISKIEELVNKIILSKQTDQNSDTSELEREIDYLVYQLYDLTEEEIRIVEESV